jgi:DGQHR domain-containing protein
VFGSSHKQYIRANALRIEQRSDLPLYVFGVEGSLVHHFASVRFAARTDDGILVGYQRDQVTRHIAEIRAYLSQPNAVLPNSIVVAFDDTVKFVPASRVMRNDWGTPGELSIPLPRPGEAKPAFIVDGQQRVTALASLEPPRPFPVVVVGFASPSETTQREQFVLVNKTKPLPRDLLNELVPHIDVVLPKPLQTRRVAAQVVEVLRFEKTSPFYGRIRGIGASGAGANISQASVVEVVEHSIKRAGALSHLYDPAIDTADVASMAHIVAVYFKGVERVWPGAWSGTPWDSRLVHGVGIVSMGRLMDVIMPHVNAKTKRAVSRVENRLSKLRSRCAWTKGRWPVLNCAWNELQNTGQDKRRLAEYLVQEYRGRRR